MNFNSDRRRRTVLGIEQVRFRMLKAGANMARLIFAISIVAALVCGLALVTHGQGTPAIPDDARKYMASGLAFMKGAKSRQDFRQAAVEFKQAADTAPQWAEAYWNLAAAETAAGDYDEAKKSLQIYLSFSSRSPKVQAAKSKLSAINAQISKQGALKARYGAGQYGIDCHGDAMYRYGGIVKDMNFHGHAGVRTISLKLWTGNENGALVNKLLVFDLTATASGYHDGYLQDIVKGKTEECICGQDGHVDTPLVMSISSLNAGNYAITLSPSDGASDAIRTTLNDLFRERARQAVYGGWREGSGTTNEDSKDYVINQVQIGGDPAHLHFPPTIQNHLSDGDASNLSPSVVTSTTPQPGP
jgi:tetratricopeptide (TPR) repeat protein